MYRQRLSLSLGGDALRVSLLTVFSFYVLVDPFQNQIRGLQIVLVLQDHVAISKDSKIRKIRHGRIAPASLIACTYCSQPANA